MTLPLCAAELSADTIYSMTAKLEQEFNGAYAQQNPTAGEFKEYKTTRACITTTSSAMRYFQTCLLACCPPDDSGRQ
jgi:hypothetical protein